MRKFINAPDQVARETLEGFLTVYGDRFRQVDGASAVAMKDPAVKVAVVSGGGSGHEPVWLEYIGPGCADAVCQGDVFAAPPPNAIALAAKAVERGRGVLFVYGNYSGDLMRELGQFLDPDAGVAQGPTIAQAQKALCSSIVWCSRVGVSWVGRPWTFVSQDRGDRFPGTLHGVVFTDR
ncbi:dihydroxyacetone kinase subunit DhaK [Nonomuraea diastatica]|uniref:DhaK domain-containing protein n=1 Tax=Nonomuraea diastatica TaxID=1848329 RepID=A0A4R4W574_9ACTN|nr:dihydroxyacetone kinase subunit DhaK [Nonomuraea diastatica]TDD11163.1 hypothetical protein E1294_45490 [Nonomuraea diastatica]